MVERTTTNRTHRHAFNIIEQNTIKQDFVSILQLRQELVFFNVRRQCTIFFHDVLFLSLEGEDLFARKITGRNQSTNPELITLFKSKSTAFVGSMRQTKIHSERKKEKGKRKHRNEMESEATENGEGKEHQQTKPTWDH